MTNHRAALRFSILDTAPIVQGSNAKTALCACDRGGYSTPDAAA